MHDVPDSLVCWGVCPHRRACRRMAGQQDTLSENKSYIGTLMAVLRFSLGVCASARAGSGTRGLGLKTNWKIFFESMICAITWKACIKREGLTFHILYCTVVPGRFNILHTIKTAQWFSEIQHRFSIGLPPSEGYKASIALCFSIGLPPSEGYKASIALCKRFTV